MDALTCLNTCDIAAYIDNWTDITKLCMILLIKRNLFFFL